MRVTIKFFLLFLLLTPWIEVKAKIYSVEELSSIPKSYIKDFYIYRLLQTGISKDEAKKLLPQVKRLSPKIYKAFVPYIDRFKRKAYCSSLKPKQLLGRFGDCVKLGLSLYRATTINPDYLIKISNEIKRDEPKLALKYQTIATKSMESLLQLPPTLFLQIFNQVGDSFRKRYYDKTIDKKYLTKLVKERAFNIMVEKIVRSNLPNLQKSIVDIDSSSLNSEANFLLGLNAIKYAQLEYALKYFRLSKKRSKFTFQKDKATFWEYLLSKEKRLLDELIKSHEINLYTLRAYEILGKFPQNILYSIDPKSDKTPFDIKEPFAWLKFKEMLQRKKFHSKEERRRYILSYNTPWSEPHIARLLYNYHDNIRYYLTPYLWYLNDTPIQRKIMIYSLARQESQFIPTEVSSSYALGMMQFMPFVAKDIAKREGIKDFQLESLFDPKIAFKFANIHLNYLEKKIHHPLFIAYAYNGGLGFLQRKILQKNYFKGGAYDPFYSMEMIPNAQARKYGKRVLANYVIYSKLFGQSVTLNSLLENLK